LNARGSDSAGVPLGFGVAALALLLVCVVAAQRLFEPPARALFSLALQHATAMAALLAVFLAARRTRARALVFVAVVAYLLVIQADTLSMAVISLPADTVLRLLTSRTDAAAVLQQAHVSGTDVALPLSVVAWRRRPWPSSTAAGGRSPTGADGAAARRSRPRPSRRRSWASRRCPGTTTNTCSAPPCCPATTGSSPATSAR
jgi:hypothetical protein